MRSGAFAILAAACVLALGACSKEADTNPNAPGSPGTGNATEVVRPAAPDGPPGGPSGPVGSARLPGASGGEVVPGTTGAATTDATQPAPPGTGLGGGLGSDTGVAGSSPAGTGTSAPMGAGAAPEGSANLTSRDAVGRR